MYNDGIEVVKNGPLAFTFIFSVCLSSPDTLDENVLRLSPFGAFLVIIFLQQNAWIEGDADQFSFWIFRVSSGPLTLNGAIAIVGVIGFSGGWPKWWKWWYHSQILVYFFMVNFLLQAHFNIKYFYLSPDSVFVQRTQFLIEPRDGHEPERFGIYSFFK